MVRVLIKVGSKIGNLKNTIEKELEMKCLKQEKEQEIEDVEIEDSIFNWLKFFNLKHIVINHQAKSKPQQIDLSNRFKSTGCLTKCTLLIKFSFLFSVQKY